MAFSRTWDAAYEALPSDPEDAKDGASRIRNFKVDIKERVEVDHSFAGDDQDGAHKKVTLLEQLDDPVTNANIGYLYTKDVGGTTELFYKNSAGSAVQLTSGGSAGIAGTARMLFQQTNAPVGWTKDTTATLNDSALRVVTGAAASGGTAGFTTHFGVGKTTDAHALTVSEMPVHAHGVTDGTHAHGYSRAASSGAQKPAAGGTAPFDTYANSVTAAASSNIAIQNNGGGAAHSHTLPNFNIKYLDLIIATKD